MQTQTIIRAKDNLPEKPEIAEGTTDELVSETDGLTVRLFGSAPDYTKKEFEDLYRNCFIVLDGADELSFIGGLGSMTIEQFILGIFNAFPP